MLVNRPNRVLEKQKAFQASPNLVHVKLPGQQRIFKAYVALFAVGVLGTGYGLQQLIAGKPT